ncbi:MAG TPA: Na+/H+ antiporter subunit E [Terrimicrobiaceae bacterium]|nr:Na+/H+ antiporter subunit E [Terrimicrobiaceae bacterium]
MISGASVHLLIALVWMFLSGNTTLGGLVLGLAAGFAMMALFRKALGCQDYIRRIQAALRFGASFLRQVAASNLRIAAAALRPDASRLRGEFFRYSVEDLTSAEIILLCQFINLTPGTVVAEKCPDTHELVLHAFASGTPEEIRRSLDAELKQPILEFMR